MKKKESADTKRAAKQRAAPFPPAKGMQVRYAIEPSRADLILAHQRSLLKTTDEHSPQRYGGTTPARGLLRVIGSTK